MALKRILFIGTVLAHLAVLPATAREIVINAVGDIMLAGSATSTFARLGYDYPFAVTTAELKRGDIAVGNLEAPIAVRGDEFTAKRFRFKAAPPSAAALKRAGFSVVTIANNHIMDFGEPALLETLRHLDQNGILHPGAGQHLAAARQPAMIQIKGARIAFLAYSLTFPKEFYAARGRAGTAPGYPAFFKADIARAKAAADYVVVSFHWGTEGATSPRPYQVAAAHAAVDAGADVVLGHHPHVLQGIERYKKGVILYSLGNFAFGSLSHSASRSAIARITLDGGVKGVELVALNVRNSEVRFQPRPLKGKEEEAVIARLNRLSREMGTVIAREGACFRIRMGRDYQMAAQQKGEGYVSAIRGD
jgi:poly-gamma-glutamate capsule biosynthesis protein CapA/YwtB (metallophosphatase superfamily)